MLDQRLYWYNVVTISLAVLEFVFVLGISLVHLDGSLAPKIGIYVLAAFFWICVAFESMFVRVSTQERRWIERRGFRNRVLKHSLPGAVSFFKNAEAAVADVILFSSAIFVIILVWTQVKTAWMIVLGISTLLLSFNLHCILNGRNYRYLKAYRLYKKEHERNE